MHTHFTLPTLNDNIIIHINQYHEFRDFVLNPVEAVVWGSGDAEDTEADVAGCDVLELSINSKPTSEMQPLMGQVGAGFCKPTQEF